MLSSPSVNHIIPTESPYKLSIPHQQRLSQPLTHQRVPVIESLQFPQFFLDRVHFVFDFRVQMFKQYLFHVLSEMLGHRHQIEKEQSKGNSKLFLGRLDQV